MQFKKKLKCYKEEHMRLESAIYKYVTFQKKKFKCTKIFNCDYYNIKKIVKYLYRIFL